MKTNSLNNRSSYFATLALACGALFSFAASGQAQNLTQTGFAGVLVPQYMASGSSTRLPIMYRATVSGLTANTSYRYYTQAALATVFGTASSGAGNPLLPISGNFLTLSSPGLTTAGTYDTFTTDANGSYTGWFGFVNTGNAAFTAGNTVYPSITLNAGGTGTAISKRLALDVGILVQAFATTAGANNCSFIQSTSSATAKNIVVLYDNVGGTGRPLAIVPAESIGVAIGSVITGYSTSAGTWNTSIPNNNANGVRRIEQRSLSAGAIVGYSTDADGSWPTGPINTVNPLSGTTAIVIAGADAPINTTAAGPVITGATTAASFFTTYGTASAGQSFNISGVNMSAGITVTPPAGFEVSTSSTFASNVGISSSPITVGTAGTIASTPVYVRLAANAPAGTYNSQNIVLSSTGATAVNIVTASTGNSVTAKGLTITGLTAENKNWDNTTTASVTGTAAFSGLISSDSSLTPGGSVTWAFADANAGANKTLTRTGIYTVSSSNYTVTQPTLTASIAAVIPSTPTITEITAGNAQLSVAFTAPTSNGGSSITNYEYSTDGGTTWITPSPAVTASPLVITGLANGTAYSVQLRANNSAGGSMATASTQATPVAPSSPTITVAPATLAGVLTTTYGTDSSTQTFAVSGSTLSGDLTVTAPAGLEISLSSGGGFAGSLNLEASSGSVASTTIYARLKADAAAGSYNARTFSVSSSGAFTQNVVTTLSGNVIGQAALTITGIGIADKVYDRTGTASITGTAAYDGLKNNESFSVTGTPSAQFATVTVGNAKQVNVTGYTAPSSNYTLTQPTLSGDITVAPLTVTGAVVTSKTYNANTTAAITGATLSGVISPDVVTLTGQSSGTFASADVGTAIAVSTAMGITGADAANYALVQPTDLTGSITQATQTITFNALPMKVVGDADFALTASASSQLPLTYASSNPAVATVSDTGSVTIVGAGTTGITVSQIGNINYPSASVARTLTVIPPPLAAWEIFGEANGGASPKAPNVSNANLTVVGLTKGSGIDAVNTGNVWGGAGVTAASKALAISGNDFATFSVTANAGYKVSFSSIPAYNIRKSGTGTKSGIWQYQKGTGAFTDIGTEITWGPTTTASGDVQPAIDLSVYPDLQDVPPGSTVTFRLVAWGASGAGGTFYINDINGQYDLAVVGSVSDYTAPVPSLSSFSPAFGSTGSTVTISGGNLLAVIGVKFNGQSAVFTRSSDQTITATVPAGIRAGKISLVYGSPEAEVLSTTNFEPLDGSGLATVVNGDGTSPYVNTAIFGKGQSNNQTLAVTVINPIANSAISTVRITLPSDFPLPNSPNFSLSGAGTVSVSGRALTVEGANVTSDFPLTVTISGLSTPDTSVSTALDGNYGITVETAGANGTLASVLVSPTVYVLVPIINLRGVDANGVPTQLGKKVAFEGVVTASGLGSTVGRTKAYVQDASAAIYIYSTAFSSAPIQGNIYGALGTLAQFRGGTQIDPGTASNLIDRGAGVLPEPTVLTLPISSTDGERYEGSLVKVVGLSRAAGETDLWATSATITLQDSALATVDLFLQPDSKNPDNSKNATTEPATYPATVVGILGQFAQVSPFTTGYQLQPRTQADLISSVVAPSALSYVNISGTVGSAITSVTPTVTGTVASYSIEPTLPAGLSIDPTTGVISGTPTVTATSAIYTVTATNAGGNTTATLTVAVVAAGSTYSGWLISNGANGSDAAFLDYVFGAATPGTLNPTLKPSVAVTDGNLVLTYNVRQGTVGLRVTPKTSADLAAGPSGWVTTDVTIANVGAAREVNGVIVQQKTASVPVSGTKKFLKVEAVQE